MHTHTDSSKHNARLVQGLGMGQSCLFRKAAGHYTNTGPTLTHRNAVTSLADIPRRGRSKEDTWALHLDIMHRTGTLASSSCRHTTYIKA